MAKIKKQKLYSSVSHPTLPKCMIERERKKILTLSPLPDYENFDAKPF